MTGKANTSGNQIEVLESKITQWIFFFLSSLQGEVHETSLGALLCCSDACGKHPSLRGRTLHFVNHLSISS